MPDIIICANFGSEQLSGLGYTGGGQILECPIEMAGHFYSAACDYSDNAKHHLIDHLSAVLF